MVEWPPVGLLTVAEVASALRVSRMTVYRLVRSGELSSFQVGRSIRVPAAVVAEYLGKAFGQTG